MLLKAGLSFIFMLLEISDFDWGTRNFGVHSRISLIRQHWAREARADYHGFHGVRYSDESHTAR